MYMDKIYGMESLQKLDSRFFQFYLVILNITVPFQCIFIFAKGQFENNIQWDDMYK